ncbi:MAG TPA: aminopeptidase P family N-terminal domain-containing protein, partial [Eoetvoesiella sp.]|uniref:aminopeptidase P family N-terminal domain-containing protein n=1 Tax=Eoetvoesiella sp. TaxID=1966355 RepID=UPI002B9FF29C
MGNTVFAERVQALRAAMAARNLGACVVPSSDPHLSEYLPEHWQSRAWLSGFEGSAGTLVVTPSFAGLWTDSRYWEQADHDLEGSGIQTMRAGSDSVPSVVDWLARELPEGSRVALHGQALSVSMHRNWQSTLDARGIRLVCELDLPGEVWKDRPALPQAPVYEHEAPFACRTRAGNLAAVRQSMAERKADWHFISTLDDVAWLLNLRGSDVSYNPVFLAHALIGRDTARLFVAPGKVSEDLARALGRDGVELAAYDAAGEALSCLPAGQTLLIDPARTTIGVIGAAAYVDKVEAVNPSHLLKSRKSAAEIDHVRRAMEQDGAALCEFFAWFEQAQGVERITELTIDEKITQARARRENFVTPSFSTIAAYNANGAMPHYHATEQAHAVIEG